MPEFSGPKPENKPPRMEGGKGGGDINLKDHSFGPQAREAGRNDGAVREAAALKAKEQTSVPPLGNRLKNS
jgi:hypothetical protein